MTPPNDDQADNESENPDYAKTVILKRCAKHGAAYMEEEGCPECEKEKKQSAEKGAG